MGKNQVLGQKGEDAVARFLIENNYLVLDRNWRIKEGEIDLIAQSKEGTICFVEVKTRSSLIYGDPLEAIDSKKLNRMQRLALAWLAMNDMWGANYRVDCARVIYNQDRFEIEYRIEIS